MPIQQAADNPQQASDSPPRVGRFVRHTGLAAPYVHDNVSTDVLAPPVSESLRQKGIKGAAASAFANERYNADASENPDFVFNQEAYRRASVMIVGRNYGTGSSRATGVSSPLAAWGVKVYIGESFGPIFVLNALRYGVLTIELPRPTIDRLAAWVVAHKNRDLSRAQITVDLEKLVIVIPGEKPIPFTYNPRFRHKLLNGLDDAGEMKPHLAAAEATRDRDKTQRPWIYNYRKP